MPAALAEMATWKDMEGKHHFFIKCEKMKNPVKHANGSEANGRQDFCPECIEKLKGVPNNVEEKDFFAHDPTIADSPGGE